MLFPPIKSELELLSDMAHTRRCCPPSRSEQTSDTCVCPPTLSSLPYARCWWRPLLTSSSLASTRGHTVLLSHILYCEPIGHIRRRRDNHGAGKGLLPAAHSCCDTPLVSCTACL